MKKNEESIKSKNNYTNKSVITGQIPHFDSGIFLWILSDQEDNILDMHLSFFYQLPLPLVSGENS